MDEMMNMPHAAQPFMHNTFWINNQVSFTFEVPLTTWINRGSLLGPFSLNGLDGFLRENSFRLLPFSEDEARRRQGQDVPPLLDLLAQRYNPELSEEQLPGFYVFPDPEEEVVRVVIFLHFEVIPGTFVDQQQEERAQPVPTLVRLVNDSLSDLRERGVPVTSAAPNWLCGASNGDNPSSHVATGCPLLPPIPVPEEAYCAEAPGLWPISLPDLPRDMKRVTGDGVTIFVLDTLPARGNITRAAQAAGEHNLRLLDLDNNVTFSYPKLYDIDTSDASQPATGKDVTGRLIGFRMPDHGLFVAGIIRDLAPDAQVECIRVLNDWCVGTVQGIIEQLAGILKRVEVEGDLFKKDVVVNLSLVIPDDADIQMAGIIKQHLPFIRENLFIAMEALADRDIIFAASAGNEGDQRFQASTTRPDALYPAAFANTTDKRLRRSFNIIPVGAVDKDGDVTGYSCYPGDGGVATYGGDVPGKDNLRKDGNRITIKDLTALDAVIGVYTSLSYPALYYKDPDPTYPAPNAHGWAYWVGTSFATPVASAVAARALELRRRSPMTIPVARPVVFPAATDSTLWTNLSSGSSTGTGMMGASQEGLMIRAVQCGYQTGSSDGKNAGCCSCCRSGK